MIRTCHLRRLVVAVFVVAGGAVSGMAVASGNPFGAHSDLVAVTGEGAGNVVVAPTAADGHGSFDARVIVNIRQTTPDMTFTVTRTVDPVPDGVCTGTAFAAVAALQTSAGGAGAVEFERTGPLLQFDLLVRVVGEDGTVLQSSCMTINAK
jgi:hypothetical protein